MITDHFARCLELVLVHEGQNSDDPHDPGGRTSRGITQREYDAYCGLHKLPPNDVWYAPELLITAIYHNSYWLPWCPKLPHGLDYLYFDMSVNMGPHEATILLQRGLGVTADGHIGIVTLSEIAKDNSDNLIRTVSSERLVFYRQLRAFRYFGNGWVKRVDEVERQAIEMIRGLL